MKRVIINALLAFVFMLLQTSFASAFGVDSVCQFGILASVVSATLAFPVTSNAISMLLLGLAFDLWVSGPPFLYALLFVIAHLILTAVVAKMRTERPVFVIVYAAFGSALFDLMQCIAYSVFYDEIRYWNMLPGVLAADVIWTGIWAAPYMWGVLALDRFIVKRRAGRLL